MKKKFSMLIALVMVISLCLIPTVAVAAALSLPHEQTYGPSVAGTSVIAAPGDLNTVDVVVEDTGDGFLQWTYTYPDSPTHTPKMTVAIDYPNGFCITTFDDGSHDGWYYAPDGGSEVWFADYSGGAYGGWAETTASANELTVKIQKSVLGLSFLFHGYANVNGNQVWIETDAYQPVGEITIDADLDVGLNANVDEIVAINVYPTTIDFGDVTPGIASSPHDINVKNVGTVTVDVDARLASLTSLTSIFQFLKLDGQGPTVQGRWLDIFPSSLDPSITKSKTAVLVVPPTYSARGPEVAQIAFIATAAQ